jgi:predicted secreted hydrolase
MKRTDIYRRLYSLGLLAMLLLLASCSFPGVVSSSAQLPVVSQQQQKVQLPPIRFPQDEAAHKDLTEWWYYTGHLNATEPNGKPHHYGFELVIFQGLRSDLPPVYAAHFAISDLTRGQFHFAQQRQLEPHADIPDGTSTKGINEHVGDWSIVGLNGSDHLVASMPDYAIDLHLLSLKPAVLHNGNGLITYGVAGFSYYYSRTRMAVSGTIVDHKQSLRLTGLAWMDHQWGNFLSLGGGGWDWFSVQLNNNTEMMLYFIHNASGQTISTYAGYIDARGNDHLIPANELRVTALDHWTSPVTKAIYPSGWWLVIDDSLLHASLTLMPQLKDQELVVYQSTGNSYWEGSVSIQGQDNGNAILGQGYVELTGYAHG